MLGAIVLLCLGSLVLGASGRTQCVFPGKIVAPCRCYHRQLSCRGSQVTDRVLAAVFRNLTSHLPDYDKQVDSFELIDSNVKAISPKLFASVLVRSYIKLRNNQLESFAIGNFDHLYLLDVSNNDFAKLNLDSFIGLNQLRILHAANIGMTTLKKEYFSHLKNLKRLDLSGNNIELVEIDALTAEYDNNFELSEIDLSFNKIRRLPENIFLVLRQPERINLASNCLETVDEIFRFSRDIVQFEPIQIVLSNNSLTTEHFSNTTFADLVARGHHIDLDLTHNKLAWVDEAVFGKLLTGDTRSVLRLSHNPIQCTNCRNRWLVERAQRRANFLNSVLLQTCIEQKKLTDLRLSDFTHCT